MKVLQFTIPVGDDITVHSRRDVLPFFYPYLHRHKEVQITWIEKGNGSLIVNNEMHDFEENDIFFIGANQAHLIKSAQTYFDNKEAGQSVSTDIFFDPNILCSNILSIPEFVKLKKFLESNLIGFKISQSNNASFISLIEAILQEQKPVNKILLFIELLNAMEQLETLQTLSSEVSMVKNESEGIRISEIYNYILHNYDKNITLDEVAEKACMTPQAFCRYFKKHTRQTFVGFLNDVRINESCRLLLSNQHYSISDIAYKCGFNSITNFNRVFKANKHISPKDYMLNFHKKTSHKEALTESQIDIESI